MKTKNILLTGVGGQGVILASDIISNALSKAGFDVKTSSIKGMSQRLGPVVSSIRFGEKVYSPVISKADYFLGFELLETLRYIDYLNKDGIGIVNNYKARIENYPKGIIKRIKKNNVVLLDGQKISDTKVINLLFLGILSRHLGIEKRFWIESIKEVIPEKDVNINLKAFEEGIRYNKRIARQSKKCKSLF